MQEVFEKIDFDNRFRSKYPIISVEADIDYVFLDSVNSEIEYMINYIIYKCYPRVYYIQDKDENTLYKLKYKNKIKLENKNILEIDLFSFINVLKWLIKKEKSNNIENVWLQDVLFWWKFLFLIENKLITYVNMEYGLTFILLEDGIKVLESILDKFILKEWLIYTYNKEWEKMFELLRLSGTLK